MIKRTLSEMLSRMIDNTLVNTSQINDFSTGSAIRSIYEAIALEQQQQQTLVEANVYWGIENGIYEAFDFHRQEARKAYGTVNIYFNSPTKSDIIIPRGVRFTCSDPQYNQRYETLEEYHIPKGTSNFPVTVYCTEIGTIGNVPKHVINKMISSIPNVRKVDNSEALLTGKEEEPVAEVKRRFQRFVETRGRATKKALKYAVESVPDVDSCYVYEETGWIVIYAGDANGNLSDNLKQEILDAVEDYRPSGIELNVEPIIKQPLSVYVTVVLNSNRRNNEEFRKQIVNVITTYLNNMVAGEDFVLSEMTQQIKNVDDYEVYDILYTTPRTNIQMNRNQIIRADEVGVDFVVRVPDEELKDVGVVDQYGREVARYSDLTAQQKAQLDTATPEFNGRPMSYIIKMVGDGVNTKYTIRHNLHTKDIIVQVMTSAPPVRPVYPKVEYLSDDVIDVDFTGIYHSDGTQIGKNSVVLPNEFQVKIYYPSASSNQNK